VLGIPSIAFCWIVWSIMGQASGAYVGPLCWAVMFLSGAAAVLQQRAVALKERERSEARNARAVPPLAERLALVREWRRSGAA
jgi:hypothetical protein